MTVKEKPHWEKFVKTITGSPRDWVTRGLKENINPFDFAVTDITGVG